MSYVVLARKWRPMSFDDLVGQGHVSQTLANAIANDRVAHAFLFTGVRGVGKTTSARILAKALNCMAGDGPTHEPCLKCPACVDIADGRDTDVQEIDGASYNGVDEVRRLQESLPYRPSRDRYKIIIVDEVHMLTASAWNAFLKTLEEPPPHVKFIFATTEVHKVPITILSRVQRFDFKLIPTPLLVERLRFVTDSEGIEAEQEALLTLGRQAAGSMRDAMSLLDQVIAWSDKQFGAEDVSRILGIASRTAVLDLAEAILRGDAEAGIRSIAAVTNEGFDISRLAHDVLELLRDIVITATCTEPVDVLELPDTEQARVDRLSQLATDDLLRVHQAFSGGVDSVTRSGQPRAALEMLTIRLARRPALLPIDDLVGRLIKLEKRLYSARPPGTPTRGGSGPATSGPATSGPATSGPATSGPATSGPATSGPATSGPATEPPKPPSRSTPQPENARVSSKVPDVHPQPQSSKERSAPRASDTTRARSPRQPRDPAGPESSNASAAAKSAQPEEPMGTPHVAPKPTTPSRQPSTPELQSVPQHSGAQPTAPDPEPHPTPKEPADSPVDRWRQLVQLVAADQPRLGAFLSHVEVLAANKKEITLQYERDGIFNETAADPATRQSIVSAALKLWDAKPKLELHAAEKLGNATVFSADQQKKSQALAATVEEAKQHPIVQAAIEELDARVRNIQLPES